MLRHFFIFGLPRTRTAWMSVWFTDGAAVCVHDALRDGGDRPLDTICSSVPEDYHGFFGVSDSALTLVLPIIMEAFPLAPLLFVRRPVEECHESLVRAGVPRAAEYRDLLERASDRCEEALDRYPERVMALDFHEIDAAAMERAQSWLVPASYFDADRWRRMDQLNITVNLKKYGGALCPR